MMIIKIFKVENVLEAFRRHCGSKQQMLTRDATRQSMSWIFETQERKILKVND
jgi:hypothetical protein